MGTRVANGKQLAGVLTFVFIFQNILNPVSPYLSQVINGTAAIVALCLNQMRLKSPSRAAICTLIVAFLILFWLCLPIAVRGNFESRVVLKYLRELLLIVLAITIFGVFAIEPKHIIRAITGTLLFHVVLVLLQIPFPTLTNITAPLFGFERELSILDQYGLRKLGASSSYDTASFFSVSAAVFFYMQYRQSRRKRFIAFLCISLFAGLMSSRTGMGMTLLFLLFVFIREIAYSRPRTKLIMACGLLGLLLFSYRVIYPLALHSLGVNELSSEQATLIFSAADYGTTGTLEALSSDHLKPLDRPLQDLVVGYAVDPNSVGRFSDIGYVKLIYHVGIVGTLLIIALHLGMLLRLRSCLQSNFISAQTRLLCRFLVWLIAASLLFNYKSLEIYSRGTGDLILILFIFISSDMQRITLGRNT